MAIASTHAPSTASSRSLWWWTAGIVAALIPIGWLEAAPWVKMWLYCGIIFGGFKWLTFVQFGGFVAAGSTGRGWAYLLAWPGMDTRAFFDRDRGADCQSVLPAVAPRVIEWSSALAMLLLGVWLFWGAARLLPQRYWIVAGWSGMVGMMFMLHFGLFRMLALYWRGRGVSVQPIMNAPLAASSLAELWGKRWNMAFRDSAHALVFRPLVRRAGVPLATLAVFLLSGVVHDAAISLPAGAGLGLPTLYFLTQGVGVFAERSAVGRRIGLGRGLRGRLFVLVVAGLGAYWLFHPAFLKEVVLPMMHVAGAI